MALPWVLSGHVASWRRGLWGGGNPELLEPLRAARPWAARLPGASEQQGRSLPPTGLTETQGGQRPLTTGAVSAERWGQTLGSHSLLEAPTSPNHPFH